MAKPVRLPTWADTSLLVTDPGVAKQSAGWAKEKPPVQYFNWWMNLVGQWAVYFDTELDAVKAQALNYDAVVGAGAPYATINDALAAVGVGAKILVISAQVLTATQILDVEGIELEFKPDVAITTVTALATGIQVTAERVKIIGGRFTAFNDAGGDIALEITATAKNTLVDRSYFLNNSIDLQDDGTNTTIGTIVNEVV